MEIVNSNFKMLMEFHLISEGNGKQLSKLSKQYKESTKKVVIPDVDSFVDQFKPGEFESSKIDYDQVIKRTREK